MRSRWDGLGIGLWVDIAVPLDCLCMRTAAAGVPRGDEESISWRAGAVA